MLLKPCRFVASSQNDLRAFPDPARQSIGLALYAAQQGLTSRAAKPLKGFGGAGVVEIVEDFDGEACRAVYTIEFAGAVYVLHCFQKKAKRAIATPKKVLDLIRQRLKSAQNDFQARTR